MNFLRLTLCCLSWTVAVVAAEESAPPPTVKAGKATDKTPAAAPLSPRFQQVRNRIEALFEHRIAPTPTSQVSNPFRIAGASPISLVSEIATGESKPAQSNIDLISLQQAVATLKVSGTFEFGGKQQLVVNSRPYKEGDIIPTQVQGQSVYLRVRAISRTSITLALNEAEMTLKF
jgi:hypothetical protein